MSKIFASAAALLLATAARADVVAHWSFDRTLGDAGMYLDSTGKSNATPKDKNQVTPFSGKAPFGGAVTFNGSPGSYLSIPAITNIQKSSFTVAAWVNMTTPGPNFIIADWPSMRDAGFVFGTNPLSDASKAEPIADLASAQTTGRGNTSRMSVARLQINARTNAQILKNKDLASVPLNEWHHMAWTWNREAGQFTYYLDGVLVAQQNRAVSRGLATSLDLAPNTRNMRIGSQEWPNGASSSLNFHGSLDELWIFDTALSGEQLTNLVKTNNIDGTPVAVVAAATPDVTPAATPDVTPQPDLTPLPQRTAVTHTDSTPQVTLGSKSGASSGGRSAGIIACLIWAISLSSYVAWGIKERTKLKAAGKYS